MVSSLAQPAESGAGCIDFSRTASRPSTVSTVEAEEEEEEEGKVVYSTQVGVVRTGRAAPSLIFFVGRSLCMASGERWLRVFHGGLSGQVGRTVLPGGGGRDVGARPSIKFVRGQRQRFRGDWGGGTGGG